ncbi:MAG: 50S ribosomal protein L6 [Kiritimatiellae bacterium]|nr:50S ribosomal protein L6 [Kiritimatiellia bacterium]
MSRIGKQPVAIPQGVTVTVEGRTVRVKGPKGELAWECVPYIQVAVKDGRVEVACERKDKQGSAVYGTTRSLIANMVRGVKDGYSKTLEIQGVGFRATLQGRKLVLALGYSHPIEFAIPEGITVKMEDGNIVVSGADKHLVGDVSARLRSFYPPEPYKGKGVRLKGEYVRRKVGKTVA